VTEKSEEIGYCECTCKFYQVTAETYDAVCTCNKTAANCQSFECKPEWNYDYDARTRHSKNFTRRIGPRVETRGVELPSIEETRSETEAGRPDIEETRQVRRTAEEPSDISEGTSAARPETKDEAFYRAKRFSSKDASGSKLSTEDFVKNASKRSSLGNAHLSEEPVEMCECPATVISLST